MADGFFSAPFLFQIEKRLRLISERSYASMLAAGNIWWPKLVREQALDGVSERVIWDIDTATIQQLSPLDGGENAGWLPFDEQVTIDFEYTTAAHGTGYRIPKLKYLNSLNGGKDPVANWVRAVSSYGAYYPQRLSAIKILDGGTDLAYDGLSFFNTAHPVHPKIPNLGAYANDFTGAASGSYPGALPIDDSVTVDVALTNLTKGLAYISGAIPQPNGAGDPRGLIPEFILHPPRMLGRVQQLTNAATIAQTAGSSGTAGGGADVRAVLAKYQLAAPVEAKEFDGARSYGVGPANGVLRTVTGNDTTYYIAAREASTTELGCLIRHKRLPFRLQTYTGENLGSPDGIDAVLGLSDELQWHYKGNEAVNYGHPYTLFRFRGS